ncbi:MAG: radical SAM protein [Candidatus Omnitrophota bacterium]|nr:MAG: radical SAM protein [Candidatus Omnitrophota bacterium]RKY43644.1 MAG: radical SAM protein [Candidatus Omnitrophota bacterium]
MELPYLLFADKKGKVFVHPYLRMLVSDGEKFRLPKREELITLPRGSSIFYLPGRLPVGFNSESKSLEVISSYKNREVFAVSSFLIPAYLRLYHPAYVLKEKKVLPLWAYSPLGYYRGKYFTTALRVDRRRRQAPAFYDNKLVKRKVKEFLAKYPKNRLYKHLSNCALNYNCLAAKNLFLKRWEAPLPTTSACNAKCLGCLSYQNSECSPSHQRIDFLPKEEEIFEVAYNHLKEAREPIVSFGQGCEGEPLMNAPLISRAVAKLREKIDKGTLHMNTNASIPKYVELLCKSGIDSFRVSINSFQPKYYNIYFRPQSYKFSDVVNSIKVMNKYNKFVSFNLLVFPGFTDREAEIRAMDKFLKSYKIDMIQLRNLNIDPDLYFQSKGKAKNILGIAKLVELLRRGFPQIKIGYFNLPKRFFLSGSDYPFYVKRQHF